MIENLRENLSVERLAKRMGMSSRNFTRVCLRETRMNPGQFVDRMCVEAAQQMIDSSAMGLSGRKARPKCIDEANAGYLITSCILVARGAARAIST